MKSSKPQVPNPRKIPNSKLQNPTSAVGSLDWWEQPELSNDTLILKDAPTNGRPFDLEERTAQFGEAIIRISKKIPRDPTNNRLIDQLVGCVTSVGANFCEANDPVSKKDFRHSISRCIKEAKESKFFLRLVAASDPSLAEEARVLDREAKELLLIFASMYRK